MSKDTGSTPQERALAEEIESTRQRLGETVEALAAKADVKGRAQRRAAEVTDSLRSKVRASARDARDKAHAAKGKMTEQDAAAGLRRRGTQVAAAAAVAALVLAWLAMRRRK